MTKLHNIALVACESTAATECTSTVTSASVGLLEMAEDLSEDGNLCVVCLERDSTWAFESCRHLCLCRPCARKFNRRGRHTSDGVTAKKIPKVCPMCRTVQYAFMEAFVKLNVVSFFAVVSI